MSIHTRDPWVEATSHLRLGDGKLLHAVARSNRRRAAALRLYLDVRPDEQASTAWRLVEQVFEARIPKHGASERRCLQALELRYIDGKTLDGVGAALDVSQERARQMIERGKRILRHPAVFPRFRAAVAMDLDDVNAPEEARRP